MRERPTTVPGQLTEDQASKIAEDAYIFGYPLVLMDVTRVTSTAVEAGRDQGANGPIRQCAGVSRRDVHRHSGNPNADTLYSLAWLDVEREPIVLGMPEMGKRYLMQMVDGWTNVFAAPGTRSTGGGKGNFAIVAPGWTGMLPKEVKELRSPTNMVWIIGRTQTNGKSDYPAVRAIQDQYKLIPLSAWGTAYTPPGNVSVAKGVDPKTPSAVLVAKMDAATFFARLNTLMKDNPPAAADADAMMRFAAIGVVPGRPFDPAKLGPAVAKGAERGASAGREKIDTEAKKPMGKGINGWSVMIDRMGRFGTDYLFRAVIARIGLGSNLPEDAVYPITRVDAEGKALTGAHRYVIRFAKGQLPPVGAFWSVTLYNSKQAFVDNPINRYAIGDRDQLKFEDDGSLTLYVQHESPGKDKESNWLPASKDEFNLVMRLYWPNKEILDGTWKPPPVDGVK